MRSSLILLTTSVSTLVHCLAIDLNQDVQHQYIPVDFKYGPNERVTANLTYGTAPGAQPVEVVMDTGSANIWVWEKNAIVNYGSPFLGFAGPCNLTVPTQYDYSVSPTSSRVDKTSSYSYGGNGKALEGSQIANDTLAAEGGSGPISNVQFALENFGRIKISDNGSCTGTDYDKSILGLSPYKGNESEGPAFRQNLYDAGLISSKTMTMWFDKHADANGRFSGGTLFGAIDKSKFTSPLIRVPQVIATEQIGLYVPKPLISIGGKSFNTSTDTTCLVDSGSHGDTLPFTYLDPDLDDFYDASGNQLMAYGTGMAYNGSCTAIPEDLTIGLNFPGVKANESIQIDVPVQNYARGGVVTNSSDAGSVCVLNIELGGCTLGAPFSTVVFLALDDKDDSIGFAKGGVSEVRGVDETALKIIGAGESFDTV